MTLAESEWAPITDDDLLAANPPKRKRVPIKDWPKRPQPSYTEDDWRIFHYWVSQKGISIDFAAQCAGIRVYDALVSLEKRDPWFYEFAVLIGHGKGRDATRHRRGRGLSMGIGGQVKDYERESEQNYTAHDQHRSDSPPAGVEGKPSLEEARRRFEALLGDRHIDERVDGQPETVRLFQRGVFDSNKSETGGKPGGGTTGVSGEIIPRERPRRSLTLNSRRCTRCRQFGHNRATCGANSISEPGQG